jgi:hypothetical protein
MYPCRTDIGHTDTSRILPDMYSSKYPKIIYYTFQKEMLADTFENWDTLWIRCDMDGCVFVERK